MQRDWRYVHHVLQSMSSFAKLAFDENVTELDPKEPETQRLILLVVKKRLSVVNTTYGAHVMVL